VHGSIGGQGSRREAIEGHAAFQNFYVVVSGLLVADGGNRMAWNRWYSLRSYVRTSLWIVPLLALLLYLAAIRLASVLDVWIDWTPLLPWGLTGTQKILETTITIMLTFIVFTFGSLLVAIQIAGGQLTPRIIASTLLSDNIIRGTVGLFIFTLLFATGSLARLETSLHPAAAVVTGVLAFGSIAAFLYLIDYAARLLRPGSILWRVAEHGLAAIESIYPEPAKRPAANVNVGENSTSPNRVISHKGKSAIVIAVNLDALVLAACHCDVLLEFIPRVGDFVGTGEPLFHVYGNGNIDERELIGAVAFGPERTIEQDSTFAFRIVVDIAIKALSKAINDPTTAVLAVDQLQRMLRKVGMRHLHDQQLSDSAGQRRLIFRTPNWEDFVELSFSEIRLYGAENYQVSRRLHAMIESLLHALPEFRHPALRHELQMLERMAEKLYSLPEDLVLARRPDAQGLGGTIASNAGFPRHNPSW